MVRPMKYPEIYPPEETRDSILRASTTTPEVITSGTATHGRPYLSNSGEIVWQRRIGGNHSASPIFADGKIYFLSEEGESTIIDAGQEYREISRNSIGEKCQASYAVSQGQILIRSEKNLWCIGK